MTMKTGSFDDDKIAYSLRGWGVPVILGIRLAIIGCIVFLFFHTFDAKAPLGLQLSGLRASVVLFYLPYAVLTLLLLIFGSKKLLLAALVLDGIVVYFLDKIIRLLFF